VIRDLTRRALRRVLATLGLARAADVEHERAAAARIRLAERARADRKAVAASAKVKGLDEKLRAAHERLLAERAERDALRGLLRLYRDRLTRAEAQLAERSGAERHLKP
jgi:hypothetical protein